MSPVPKMSPVSRYQKVMIGVLGGAMLALGVVMYAVVPAANVFVSAILIRVGVLLCVIWLAFDQMILLSRRFSAFVLAAGFGLLVLVAVRPNLSKIVVVVAVGLVVLSFISRFLRTAAK